MAEASTGGNSGNQSRSGSFLGLDTEQLAGLSVDELVSNETAIKMVVHYYRQLVDENKSLRNDINTLRTYADAYSKQKSNSATGAILLAISNISIAFGVNLLTADPPGPGWWSIGAGVAMVVAGAYFSFFKDRS